MENNRNILSNKEILVEEYTVNIVDYERYEKWLESKEAEGWNLSSVKYISASVESEGCVEKYNASIEARNSVEGEHVFCKREKRKVRYCIDCKYIVEEDYKKIFEDFDGI